ncbi:MAG: AAA family ATPase, partial [Flavobacteriaceae bacterium]|nr:AAA family ATPase [Flavobacteriaceae bacterium]
MSDVAAVEQLVSKYNALKSEIKKVIVGQDEVVEQVLLSIFSGGHALLIGVPGLAKTLLVNTVAEALGLKFKRIQFTPDLMPSDILGSEILDNNREFKFIKGPIFANIILADEINRTPPKTQAALLEAMQERAVTVAGHHYKLDLPYFVLATQNPIEQEGTYPLPEAQLDRFMFAIN